MKEQTEYGHTFQLREGATFTIWDSEPGDGNPVKVIAPNVFDGDLWTVYVPHHMPKQIHIAGEDAEARAFSVAASFIEQRV